MLGTGAGKGPDTHSLSRTLAKLPTCVNVRIRIIGMRREREAGNEEENN